MTLVDTHAHLDMPQLKCKLSVVLERAKLANVRAVITAGIDILSSKEAIDIAAENEMVYATVGIHPHSASAAQREDLMTLKGLSAGKKVVALGEMGLDFFKNLSPPKAQLWVFQEQLDIADELNLPIVVHERNAQKEVYSMLRARGARENRGVIHCFSGDLDLAMKYLELGFLISIPGIVTFKKAETLKEVSKGIPLYGLLLETDAPFLAPEPFRGKTNEPSFVVWTAREVARLRGISLEELAWATTENAKRLFKIGIPGS